MAEACSAVRVASSPRSDFSSASSPAADPAVPSFSALFGGLPLAAESLALKTCLQYLHFTLRLSYSGRIRMPVRWQLGQVIWV